ncbi:MAG: Aerobic cobaltochelatase subunit CobS small subunit [Candidatus Hodgkinia cicadicola]|nr:MAG: Aerobic cobaltochelatase subunit CobS small subunit [Candidatus Hodgkinia cicadicola]
MFKLTELPNKRVDVKLAFALNINAFVPAFSLNTQFVNKLLPRFQFDKQITMCVLTGLVYNKRVLISGAYGAGKSSHIEQVCSRLNWPCIRINMDSWLTRLELVGRDIITAKNGLYAIKFKYGIVPWATKKGVSLILDDYDACKPETKFVLNKLLESNGEISVPENNKVITPHSIFRVFATCNNIRTSDHIGTYKSNLAQLDRWNLVALMSYPNQLAEFKLIAKKAIGLLCSASAINKISKLANVLRRQHAQKNVHTLLSTRSVISWVELSLALNSISEAFRYVYLNKCANKEHRIITKCYNRVFGTKC